MTAPYNFVELKPLIKHEMPTMLESYDWLEANQKPVEATTLELGYEIERLKKDAAFHKQTLINYQNETHAQLNDYKNLHVDYLNSQFEVKQLKAQLEQLPKLKRTVRWLMSEHLDITLGDK
jgi:chromosome segregation ATPase